MSITKDKKITLTVLIVAIIALLIFAGVTVMELTRNNKPFNKNSYNNKEQLGSEATYKVNNIDGDIMQITVKIKDTLGIEKVITPENKEIIPQNNKTEIAIDYEVISGNNYIFKVKEANSDELKEYILKANTNTKPEINQNESYVYPILTEYGVVTNKIVEIDYGQNEDNYYSIDDGKTWEKYTDPIKLQNECTIIAKTIIEGEITKEEKKKITFELASDAVGSGAYDDNDVTGYTITGQGNHYIEVSEEMVGQSFRILMESPGHKSEYSKIELLDENKTIIETIYNGYNSGGKIDKIYEIKEKTKYINIHTINGGNETIVYEVNVENSPKIIENAGYAKMKNSGLKIENDIEIEYFNTTEQKLYKINDGDWKEYTEKLTVSPGTTIQAKGIDAFGKETRTIATYTATTNNETIGSEAYDNDDATGYKITGQGNHYIEVSEEMIGQSFRILMESPGFKSRYSKIELLDENKTIIETIYNGYNSGGKIDKTYEIKEKTKYINIHTINSANETIVYEIQNQ